MSDNSARPGQNTLDEALQLLPAPVAIIGVASGEARGGLTAAWVTRVSIDPPLVLVSIGHQRHTWTLLRDAQQFTVSVLAEGQVAEGRLFGRNSQADMDKWAEVDHVLLGEGIPALTQCATRWLCAIENRFTTGDHDCFVGRVLEAEIVAGGPALPMRGHDYAP